MLLKCKEIAQQQLEELRQTIDTLTKIGCQPHIKIIRIDGDPASEKYVNNKVKKCEEFGIRSTVELLSRGCSQVEVELAILRANDDANVHGILLQLPVPEYFDVDKLINLIDPKKDVDCLTKANVGRLFDGDHELAPCTPAGIMRILKESNIPLEGKDVLIINRSMLVGKPLAELMLGENATVTIAHSKTKYLYKKMLNADVIVTAVGRANFITKDMLKGLNDEASSFGETKVIIDVSINQGEDGRLCGDVIRDEEYVDSLSNVLVTAVPGGVGLTTVAGLLVNGVNCTIANNVCVDINK